MKFPPSSRTDGAHAAIIFTLPGAGVRAEECARLRLDEGSYAMLIV